MYPQISHITYHYLLNGNSLQGNYLYDVMHLPNKSLQEKVLGNYLEDRIRKLTIIAQEDTKKGRFCRKELEEINSKKTLIDKMNVHFKNAYERVGIDKVLGKPYFGVWGIHTTPADLFGINPKYKYRVGIDCDSVDPSFIVVKVGTGVYDTASKSMKKLYFKYSDAIWKKYCEPYTEINSDLVKDAYSHGKEIRTVSSGVPDIVFFVPKLKFDPKNFEEAIR